MAGNTLLTRKDVNALFEARTLNATLQKAVDSLCNYSVLSERDQNQITGNIDKLSTSMSHMEAFQVALAKVFKDMLLNFHRLADFINSLKYDGRPGTVVDWFDKMAIIKKYIEDMVDLSAASTEDISKLRDGLDTLKDAMEKRAKAEKERIQKEDEAKAQKRREERKEAEKQRQEKQRQAQKDDEERKQREKDERERKKREKEERERKRREEAEKERKRLEEEEKENQRLAEEEKERKRLEKIERDRIRREEAENERIRRLEEEKERQRIAEEEKERKRIDDAEKERIRLEEEEKERIRREEEEKERKRLEEEEKERVRLEEERRQKEENDRKEAEERERKLLEEQKRREYEAKANPDNWIEFGYDIDEMTDIFKRGIGCKVRVVPDNEMDKDMLACRAVNIRVNVGLEEPRVSNIVNLRTVDEEPLSSEILQEFPVQIGVPYESKDVLLPLVYAQEGRGRWTTLETQTTEQNGVPLALFRRKSIKDLKFVVTSAKPMTSGTFRQKGGTLQTQDDLSVKIIVRQKTFKESGEIKLKVVAQAKLDRVREQYDMFDSLDDASSMAIVNIDENATQPIILQIRFPERYKEADNKSAGKRVHVMTSVDGDQWERSDPGGKDNDWYNVDIVDTGTREVFLMRTRSYSSKKEPPSIAKDITMRLREFPASLICCHKDSDPTCIYLRCCPKETTEHLLEELKEQGYSAVHRQDLHLQDWTLLKLEFNFEGNLSFVDDSQKSVQLTFMSKVDAAGDIYEHKIMVKNPYTQKKYDTYRGKLRVFDVTELEDSNDESSPGLLCEIPVTLPKIDTVPKQRTFYGDLLNMEYIKELAEDLGPEWVRVACELGQAPSTIQQVKQRNAEEEAVKFDMLYTWYMKSKRSADKVQELIKALKKANRDDLAHELELKHKNKTESEKTKTKEKLYKDIAKRISDDPKALKNWMAILKALGLDEGKIGDIEAGSTNRIARLQNGLLEWVKVEEDKATPGVLIDTLNSMGHRAAAEQVSYCR